MTAKGYRHDPSTCQWAGCPGCLDRSSLRALAAAARGEDAISPSHYQRGGIEVCDAIEAWDLGYHLGNVIKYVARAGHKDPSRTVEDLRKAQWYLERHIKRLTK